MDDFSRYNWNNFIREKSDTFNVFKDLCQRLERVKGSEIVRIRSDHGNEFQGTGHEGIGHEFSALITPNQNGVVECRNITLQELSRVMLHAKNILYNFWAKDMNTSCHIHSRVTITHGTKATQYELWKWRKPNVKYFHIFGSMCYILVDREKISKMDPKSDEGILPGYSTNSRACIVYNKCTKTMMESTNND